jgi:hypothetical protein
VAKSWLGTVASGKGWALFLLLAAAVLLLGWGRRWRAGLRVPPEVPPLAVGACVAFAVSHILNFQGCELRYLLPTGFCGVLLFTLAVRTAPLRVGPSLQALILVAAAVLLGKHITNDISTHTERIEWANQMKDGVDRLVGRADSGPEESVVVFGWRSPQPSFALRIFAGKDSLLLLDKIYSNDGHYDPFAKRVFLPRSKAGWDYLVLTSNDLSGFPEPIGPVLGTVGPYMVVLPPDPTDGGGHDRTLVPGLRREFSPLKLAAPRNQGLPPS